MEPPTRSRPSPPTPNLTQRQIQILEALHEHAYETMDIEYPWYLLWNECFTQLNNLFSDTDIHLAVGPQQQFFIRKHRLLVLNPSKVPQTRSNVLSGKASPLLFLDEEGDCAMADASFGSGGTNDGRGYPEEEEAHRIPDFAIFRLPLQKSIRKTPPLPSALIENKSIRLEGLPINAFMMDLMADDDESKRDRFAVALLMSETIEQAREQLECLFQEYPLIPGEPDTLSKVYFMIIVGGWFHIEEVTRDNWKNFPANNEISATYMFEGDGDKTISRELLELWPKLRV